MHYSSRPGSHRTAGRIPTEGNERTDNEDAYCDGAQTQMPTLCITCHSLRRAAPPFVCPRVLLTEVPLRLMWAICLCDYENRREKVGIMITPLQGKILRICRRTGGPSLFDISQSLCKTKCAAREPVKQLVQEGYLRMKDDDQGHEWVYVLTENGRAVIAKATA